MTEMQFYRQLLYIANSRLLVQADRYIVIELSVRFYLAFQSLTGDLEILPLFTELYTIPKAG